MNSVAPDFSIISVMIWEANGLARNLHACYFKFTPFDGNRTTHVLVGDFSLDYMDRFWVKDVPPNVMRFVAANRRTVDFL
ncbi:hypothetical protein GQ457_03G013110 [Hibiscus cannabinus]